MNKNYRGDSFWRSYEIEYENSSYSFQEGDYLKVAFCSNNNRFLEKRIEATSGEKKIDVQWTPEEMSTLLIKDYILEVEITTLDFRKTYQEIVTITEDKIISKE